MFLRASACAGESRPVILSEKNEIQGFFAALRMTGIFAGAEWKTSSERVQPIDIAQFETLKCFCGKRFRTPPFTTSPHGTDLEIPIA